MLVRFEAILPHLARDPVQGDTDFLVNLTNNGWFGESAAQWQHAAGAVFRAVENGLPLVRCSNNGLSCWIGPHGQLRRILRDSHGSVYGPGFFTAEIPLLEKDTTRPPTFYHRQGDLFGWICVAIGGGILARRLLQERSRRSAASTAATVGAP